MMVARCTCERAVIEALEELAQWVEECTGPGGNSGAMRGVKDKIKREIAKRRAEAKAPAYTHQSYGWCPVCGYDGSESDHKCRECAWFVDGEQATEWAPPPPPEFTPTRECIVGLRYRPILVESEGD